MQIRDYIIVSKNRIVLSYSAPLLSPVMLSAVDFQRVLNLLFVPPALLSSTAALNSWIILFDEEQPNGTRVTVQGEWEIENVKNYLEWRKWVYFITLPYSPAGRWHATRQLIFLSPPLSLHTQRESQCGCHGLWPGALQVYTGGWVTSLLLALPNCACVI